MDFAETALPTSGHDITNTVMKTCVSCGSDIDSKFCPKCGEKKLDFHDFAVKHYLEESVEGLTHFDSKFFRTVKLLVTKPGLLSVYFSEGRRVNYLKPFQLFIICNVIFFLLTGRANVFSQPLSSFYNYDPYVSLGSQRAINARASTNEKMNLLATAFNEKMSSDSKTYIVVLIPVFALFFMLLFYRTKKYFSEHLVFSTYFFAFMLLFFTAYTLFITWPVVKLSGQQHSGIYELVSMFGMMIVLLAYLTIGGKRFYKVSLPKAFTKALLMSLIFTVFVMVYRMLLFYKILYTVHL